MKIKIAALLAAILGVLGVFLFLVAFGTDYWLLVTEKCGGFEAKNNNHSSEEDGKQVWKEGGKGILTFHHEGFFWRCWFFGEDYRETIWNFWFTSQAHPKHCMNAYLFPMPIVFGPHPHPSYDTTAVYRGFWTALIVLAITASLVGVFLLVCGVPFVNARFYKVGGGFLMAAVVVVTVCHGYVNVICHLHNWLPTSQVIGEASRRLKTATLRLGDIVNTWDSSNEANWDCQNSYRCLFTLLIFMFVVWKEFAADLRKYVLLERSERCPSDIPLSVYYGWSFMFAAAGIPLVLLSGLLFYLVGHSILKELE